MTVIKGNKIKVSYEGKLENGEVFDSSKHGDHEHLLEFEVGAGDVIVGFDNAVIGMNIVDIKTITITPSEGYGESDPENIAVIPLENFPKDQQPQVGMTMVLGGPNGEEIPATVVEVDGEEVSLDVNHPLAGKKLIFTITVREIA